ncbi:tRNA (adenosine(37)-N6)-threonylcarbamoyltransferase complex dimerization subunit type 1 TsaB [Sphingomicrobium flavum]|uniref:tRNA (adenosine(37)-N6)-threonylcarbamoyltransferase complex dimerization subunit type 1 TsaB n=1 Tax=Sphingomicrobium flavum TaxID=1229164 RepID=UPI0021AE3069|nr:tRNA (adenosine(37)-N6)-threonylcarbamoyltransferase complex dimerization subunit type 1 TsaB [Sphingomicrobium flavum]
MILAIDTSTAACSVALFGAGGELVGHVHEVLGRGHAEQLVPMIHRCIGDHVPAHILVGVGPGSFTGIRVGIAAAQGLAIGWQIPVHGLSSLALIAAHGEGSAKVAAAMLGGHGELFVQQFDCDPLIPACEHQSLAPFAAARVIDAPRVIGPAAQALIDARGSGEAIEHYPNACDALHLPKALRSLPVKPLYGRAPDAKPKAAA